MDSGAGLTNVRQHLRQRMSKADFVFPIGTDQQEVPRIRFSYQMSDQIERCRIQPLQIIEEQDEGVSRPGKDGKKSEKHHLEAVLRVLRRL